jgi:endonuclease YncB( thermonuclease family)
MGGEREPTLTLRDLLGAAAGALVLFAASTALADPCEAPLPKSGERFSGPVRYVGDGDSVCLGPTSDPAGWIEIRLADFYAPELHADGGLAAKNLLSRIVMGRRLECVAEHRSYDRIVAACTLDGRSLGQLLRRAGGQQGGNGFSSRR